jgi:hypothetical protein
MTEVAHDDERFLRAYPAAVSAGRWEEVARLLSGKCRALEKKAAASNKANEALVAALEAVQKGVPDVLRRECLNQVVEDALALAHE